MFIRKLVKAGAASYTVALPKEWITQNSLDKGNLVYIKKISNNELLVSTELKTENLGKKELTINIEEKSLGSIQRELTSAYINNYSKIIITGKELYKDIKDIRGILNNFAALEITEQTSTKIEARDMLNLHEVSIEKTIRRMDIIVRSILKDTIKPNKDMSESIGFRDSDINKLYFLLFKIIKTSLKKPEVAKIVGIENYTDILSLWYLILNLEGIADNIVDMFSLYVDKGLEIYPKTLKEAYEKVNDSYLDVMASYYKDKKDLADSVASRRIDIFDNLSRLSESTKDITIIKIIENLKEVENSICNIARVVLDKE